MTEEVIADVAAEATVKPKSKAKQKPTEGFKVYVTSAKHTYPMDIQIAGEIIVGQWTSEDGLVEYLVPAELCAGFERHFHFTTGNIVAA